jgi:hypothetical protein
MESNNRDIKLQKCTTGSRRQLFTAGPGDFNGSRFELQPVQVAVPERGLTRRATTTSIERKPK